MPNGQILSAEKALSAKGFRFVGSGVSGGEEGARFGPHSCQVETQSLGRSSTVWEAIAAKVDADNGKPLEGAEPKPIEGGVPCSIHRPKCAGHYVKMVHNGIEYGDMQMICEAYDLMQSLSV